MFRKSTVYSFGVWYLDAPWLLNIKFSGNSSAVVSLNKFQAFKIS